MKKTVSILTFIILFKISYCQDSSRRFEFGSTIFTMNSFKIGTNAKSRSFSHFSTGERPPVELINGLFFRFTKNRLAYRVHTSYSDYSSSNTYTTDSWPYILIGGNINNKDFRIGVGCQYSILAQRHSIYTSFDMAYRYVNASGSSFGGGVFSRKFTSKSNGADCFIGLGFKFNMFANFSLSSEVGYNTSLQLINSESIGIEPNSIINNVHKSNYTQVDAIPIIKLHLTTKF